MQSPRLMQVVVSDVARNFQHRRAQTLKSRATAIPSAAEMEVEEWPAPNGSYSLSERFVKPVPATAHAHPFSPVGHACICCTKLTVAAVVATVMIMLVT